MEAHVTGAPLQAQDGCMTVTCSQIYTLGFPKATRDCFIKMLQSQAVLTS